MIKRKVVIDKANRLYQLPPDILSMLRIQDRRKLIKRADLLDLASFNWTAEFETDTAYQSDQLRPATRGKITELKEALAAWMLAQHRVRLNPEKEIFLGGRISSLIFSLALAYIDTDDLAFVPEIGVPLYRRAVTACGGETITYPLNSRTEWNPDFERITTNLGRVARVLFLNSPHNPTGSELGEKAMAHLVWTAARENTLLINDAAYQGIPSRNPISLLSVPGGKQVGVEVYSFAYMFGLPPLPFGFVAGHREIIAAMKLSADIQPTYVPELFVDLALRAVRRYPSESLKNLRDRFSQAAAEANRLFQKLPLEPAGNPTVPFVWTRLEQRSPSRNAARLLYRRSRILVVPGTDFGETGQGFLRFSLTAGPERFAEAASRIKKKMTLWQAKEE